MKTDLELAKTGKIAVYDDAKQEEVYLECDKVLCFYSLSAQNYNDFVLLIEEGQIIRTGKEDGERLREILEAEEQFFSPEDVRGGGEGAEPNVYYNLNRIKNVVATADNDGLSGKCVFVDGSESFVPCINEAVVLNNMMVQYNKEPLCQ